MSATAERYVVTRTIAATPAEIFGPPRRPIPQRLLNGSRGNV